jgi:hypothetical protein
MPDERSAAQGDLVASGLSERRGRKLQTGMVHPAGAPSPAFTPGAKITLKSNQCDVGYIRHRRRSLRLPCQA